MTAAAVARRREWFANVVVLAILASAAIWLLSLHGGWPGWTSPGIARVAAAGFVIAAYLGTCAGSWLLRRGRAARVEPAVTGAVCETDTLLVAHASQTGFAEQLARQTAESLRGAGIAARVLPLASLDAATLARTPRALFIASTTGEGDAPDAAAAFLTVLGAPAKLAGLRYGVLALGDREYRNFCAFGKRLDAWLRACGAEPWFDPVEVDDGDPGALRHWQRQLGLLGSVDLPDWSPPRYDRWRLRERRLSNPGSVGGACFHVILEPADGALPAWQAGDIAEIGPRHAPETVAGWLRAMGAEGETILDTESGESLATRLAGSRLPEAAAVAGLTARAIAARLEPLPHREYSIASLPADGAIELLVRRMLRPDGSSGLGSGWLCEHAPVGADVALRIRGNSAFHAPRDDRPLILIGNGTGIAGLRALLRQRIAEERRDNWLLFGERNAACDFHYRDEIEKWQADGWIARVDLAFSRDQPERVYVQQRVAEAASTLRAYIEAGAAIHVCGSLEGMAPGVDAALRGVLGKATLERLRVEGRYRRDVY